jgi:hypothetical protein
MQIGLSIPINVDATGTNSQGRPVKLLLLFPSDYGKPEVLEPLKAAAVLLPQFQLM